MTFYRYRVWCPECCGEDFQGCFDGGSEHSEGLYLSVEHALTAAERRVRDTLYHYQIEVDGEPRDLLVPYSLPPMPPPTGTAAAFAAMLEALPPLEAGPEYIYDESRPVKGESE